ncbi:MAG: hypothetical protein AB7U83_15770 [Vicinamibacterales bacterium]
MAPIRRASSRPTAPSVRPHLVCLLAALTLAAALPAAGQGGAGAGQRAAGQPKAATAASGRVRVPTSHANVHVGPSTGAVLLVMAARGTEFEVTGRDKEWIQVALTPEVRKTGIVVRWYRNETRGWLHDSTIQVVAAK